MPGVSAKNGTILNYSGMSEALRQNDVTDLIERIGDAALDETLWPEVMRVVARHLDASSAVMVRQNHASGLVQGIQVGLDPASEGLFRDHYSARNLLRQHSEIHEAHGSRAVTVRPWVRDLLHRSEYYNDFLKRFDMASLAWVFLDFDGKDASLITFGRPGGAERFETADVDRLTRLMPHLMRSYAISRRLGGSGSANAALPRYLEPLPYGAVLLDAFGRIVHANRSARTIAAARDGIMFTRDGLAATAEAANARLSDEIRRAVDPRYRPRAIRSIRLPRPGDARPLAVAVCPLEDGAYPFLFGRASVLVEIRDLSSAGPALDAWLAECLDLTRAEARVAGLLLAGHDTFAIASRLGISRATVRRYLEQLTSKTGTHRQAELVRLLGQVAAMYRATDEGAG
jgi:DNA-binding CsgD family transcriptional regulator